MSGRKRERTSDRNDSKREHKRSKSSKEDDEKIRSQMKKLNQQVQNLKHVETFYEKPPPGYIKEHEEKPEDCIPAEPGNEEARSFLANAPTRGLWMPLGKEVKAGGASVTGIAQETESVPFSSKATRSWSSSVWLTKTPCMTSSVKTKGTKKRAGSSSCSNFFRTPPPPHHHLTPTAPHPLSAAARRGRRRTRRKRTRRKVKRRRSTSTSPANAAATPPTPTDRTRSSHTT
uniref:uncharacterized protein LOC131101686 isoform X1 n=1 Tax=Doryrhamphus excisus TaxID=161450 RepID=UPI0025AE9C23|nr:uncharacterized protein LOC131101686 isoform X1 [Doryrhamphus excisus]